MNPVAATKTGLLSSFLWPNSWKLSYKTADGGAICPTCAKMAVNEGLTNNRDVRWLIVGSDVAWGDARPHCVHCKEPLYVSATGKDSLL
jgi:hypothetical protein